MAASAPDTNDAATDRDVPTPVRDLLRPRWPLLSALLCIAVVSVGSVLWYTLPCTTLPAVSLVCGADRWPGVVPGALLWLLFGAGWIAAWCFGPAIDGPGRRRGPLGALLRALSDFAPLRPLLLLFGAIGLLVVVVTVLANRVQPLPIALALLPAMVAGSALLYRPPEPGRAPSAERRLRDALAETDSPLFRLRSLPPLNYVWPNRPRGERKP